MCYHMPDRERIPSAVRLCLSPPSIGVSFHVGSLAVTCVAPIVPLCMCLESLLLLSIFLDSPGGGPTCLPTTYVLRVLSVCQQIVTINILFLDWPREQSCHLRDPLRILTAPGYHHLLHYFGSHLVSAVQQIHLLLQDPHHCHCLHPEHARSPGVYRL